MPLGKVSIIDTPSDGNAAYLVEQLPISNMKGRWIIMRTDYATRYPQTATITLIETVGTTCCRRFVVDVMHGRDMKGNY